MLEIAFVSEMWKWKGAAAWHVITVPVDGSVKVVALAEGPVEVTVACTRRGLVARRRRR